MTGGVWILNPKRRGACTLGHVSICTTIVPRLHGFHYRPGGILDLIGQTTLAATHSRLKITVSRCRDVNPECAACWQQLCNIGHHVDSAFISHEVSHETGIQDRTAC